MKIDNEEQRIDEVAEESSKDKKAKKSAEKAMSLEEASEFWENPENAERLKRALKKVGHTPDSYPIDKRPAIVGCILRGEL